MLNGKSLDFNLSGAKATNTSVIIGSENKAVCESGSWNQNTNSNIGLVMKKLTRYDDIKEEEEMFPEESSKDLESRSLASDTPLMVREAQGLKLAEVRTESEHFVGGQSLQSLESAIVKKVQQRLEGRKEEVHVKKADSV